MDKIAHEVNCKRRPCSCPCCNWQGTIGQVLPHFFNRYPSLKTIKGFFPNTSIKWQIFIAVNYSLKVAISLLILLNLILKMSSDGSDYKTSMTTTSFFLWRKKEGSWWWSSWSHFGGCSTYWNQGPSEKIRLHVINAHFCSSFSAIECNNW